MFLTSTRVRVLLLLLSLALCAGVLFAQITTTTIHGIVRDPSGAVVPNAVIKVKDTATGLEKSTSSGSEGVFAFPNLVAGTYQLSASATGFQNTVLNDIFVDTGRVTDVSVTLSVGTSTQTVEVSAAAAQLETTSNEVGVTINNSRVQNLPYASRDGLQFALLMAGNSSANDTTGRNSTYNGLPNASLNITLDGMNNNSQRFKSGGTSFYTFAPARIDAIDQLTVSTTGLGAEASAEGAMTIRFTTKRGTDQYHFTVGEQFANEDLNSNSFFNNLRGQAIPHSRQNNPYGSIGGPLLPFVPYLKNKLFFFAYFEAQPQPATTTNSTVVLTPDAQQGLFTYNGTDGVQHKVNLLSLAGGQGYTGSVDPTISNILGQINSTQTKATGSLLDVTGQPYFKQLFWSQPQNTLFLFPTARVDYQATPKLAWHGTWNLRYQNIAGGPNYPGLTNYNYGGAYKITTYVGTNAIDYAITPHLFNNVTFGVQSNGEYFYQGSDPSQWGVYGNRNIVFPAMTVNVPTIQVSNASATPTRLSPVVTNQTPFIRNNPVYQLTDNLNWVRGRHTILMGGSFLHTSFYETSYGSAGVPSYNLGLATGDPVGSVLQAGLPGINTSNGDLANAQALYSFLTGRLSSISGSTNVDEKTLQYRQFAPVTQRFAFTTGGLYIQDSFRIKPTLTLNYGLRWQLDGAIHNTNGIDGEPTGSNFFGPSTGLFQPGVLSGNLNPVVNNVKNPYSADLVNPAPNFGFAWNPAKEGLLGRILGKNKTVIRGAFSITSYAEGLNAISNVLSGNQGTTQSISAVPGNTGFPLGGVNLSSPAPPLSVFPSSFTFPVPQANYVFTGGNSLYMVNPNLVTPYVENWNIGIQRQLPGGTLLEVRYVGNRSLHQWHYQNINEVNIYENGFLPQFVQAQQNLAINQSNGKGNTFINNGLPGQAAIPIFETAFGGSGSQQPLAANSGFSNSTFVTNLQQGVAGTLANSLASTSTNQYYCRLVGAKFGPCAAAGFTGTTPYPTNFFAPNPFATSLNYQDDNGSNSYHGLQMQVQKDAGHGFVGAANFTWSHALGTELNASGQTADYTWFTLRNGRLSYGPSPFDRRFVFNTYWTYDLPIGKNRWLNVQNSVLDKIVGGWTIGGIQSIQTGAPNILNGGRNTVNNLAQSGVVLGSGLTLDQFRDKLAHIPDTNKVISGSALISDVSAIALSNGTPNPAYYGPAATPGTYGQLLYLYAASNFYLNMSLNKEVVFKERLHWGFRMEALNFLNHPWFPLGNTTATGNNFGQITSTISASGNGSFNRVVLLRSYISW